jgi:hypothetical protein
MSLFDEWHRRHLAADPQEPASPPPFKTGDRVMVSSQFEDAAFITGTHGVVLTVEFTTDPNNEYGPWDVRVLLDGDGEPMHFAAHELTRETEPAPAPVPPVVTVTQPEDEEGFAADAPYPTIPFRENVSATPIYDELRSCAAFPYQVEADLKALTERNAR